MQYYPPLLFHNSLERIPRYDRRESIHSLDKIDGNVAIESQ